ncbi:MAG: acyl-CoA desaturase [Bacteroidota bacterium]
MIIIAFFIAHWYLSLFFQTFFLHRYAAHKMFTMGPISEKVFYILTWLTQGSSYLSPRAYAVLHRMHHAYSDTPNDPHSPHHTENLFTMMWETKNIYNDILDYDVKPEARFTKDLPDWAAFDKFADLWYIRVGWGVLYSLFYIWAISIAELPGTHWWMYSLLPLHYLMGPVHGAIVNWCGHKYGYSNFDNNDESKNTLVFDFLMLGELFQNNHHKLPKRQDFAARWFEIDPTYPVMKVLESLKVIKIRKLKRA